MLQSNSVIHNLVKVILVIRVCLSKFCAKVLIITQFVAKIISAKIREIRGELISADHTNLHGRLMSYDLITVFEITNIKIYQ